MLVYFFLVIKASFSYIRWTFIFHIDSQEIFEHLLHAFPFIANIVWTCNSKEFAKRGLHQCHQDFFWPKGKLNSLGGGFLITLGTVPLPGVPCSTAPCAGMFAKRPSLHQLCIRNKVTFLQNALQSSLMSPLSCLYAESSSLSRWQICES